MQQRRLPLLHGLLIIAVAFLSSSVTSVYAAELQCWRCQNGFKASKICEKGPLKEHKDTGSGSQGEVTVVKYTPPPPGQSPPSVTPEKGCKSLIEFFTKHSIVTAEWGKRNMPKSKGRSNDVANSTERAYCVTFTVVALNTGVAAQVYRDCVWADKPEDIDQAFSNMVDIKDIDHKMLEKNPGQVNYCKEHKVGSERGTKRMNICFCDKNKCNDKEAKGGSGGGDRLLPSALTVMGVGFLAFNIKI